MSRQKSSKCLVKRAPSVSSKEQPRVITPTNSYENVAKASWAPGAELLDNSSGSTSAADDVQYMNTAAVNIADSPNLNQTFDQHKASEYESIDDVLTPAVKVYVHLRNEMNSEYQRPYTALSGKV